MIEKIKRADLGHYECLSSPNNTQSTVAFDLKRSDLLAHRFPPETTSGLRIEFQSSINQLKFGGKVLINCSSSDKSSVQWILDQKAKRIVTVVRNSSLSIPKFSASHFGYYRCANKRSQKLLVLSTTVFELVKQFNLPKPTVTKYNRSVIEIIRGKYIGDNITLICRIGQGRLFSSSDWISRCLQSRADVSQGKVIWSNLPKRVKNLVVRGPRLEFSPFQLEHHHQYRCLIKSIRSSDILRTLSFNTYANIFEETQRKPQMNLTVDMSRLQAHGELRLICATGLKAHIRRDDSARIDVGSRRFEQ